MVGDSELIEEPLVVEQSQKCAGQMGSVLTDFEDHHDQVKPVQSSG
jgi:hypothetical protein